MPGRIVFPVPLVRGVGVYELAAAAEHDGQNGLS
jgi:hypothetical protein